MLPCLAITSAPSCGDVETRQLQNGQEVIQIDDNAYSSFNTSSEAKMFLEQSKRVIDPLIHQDVTSPRSIIEKNQRVSAGRRSGLVVRL